MRLLLDTSIIIYAGARKSLLSNVSKIELASDQNHKFISSISVWEILQKTKTGKLPLPVSPKEMIYNMLDDYNAEILEFSSLDALYLENLPEIHNDPFDRMLICQTINNGLTLVTDDKFIAKYPIKTIW